jgi:hypothetical protein
MMPPGGAERERAEAISRQIFENREQRSREEREISDLALAKDLMNS